MPDYGAGDGGPGGRTAARADSGADGDLRFTGCPVLWQPQPSPAAFPLGEAAVALAP